MVQLDILDFVPILFLLYMTNEEALTFRVLSAREQWAQFVS